MSNASSPLDPKALCLQINEQAPTSGLFDGDRTNLHQDSRLPWRISPEPFWLTPEQYHYLEALGPVLLKFYQASNLLYNQSTRGLQPSWVHQYLDQGKPERILEMNRWNRLKSQLPLVIRPDLLLTENGFRIAELDSIPGGIGFTGQISQVYANLGYEIIGGSDGLLQGFYDMLQAAVQKPQAPNAEPVILIIVSDESEPYRQEMQGLANYLLDQGKPVYCQQPNQVLFDSEGLLIEHQGQHLRVDIVYRFFELFDLPNVPKAEIFTYFSKKNALRLTPPPKAFIEEKMWLAFLHHPLLQTYWQRELGSDKTAQLQEIVPHSWIVDPTPAPPHTVIPNLEPGGYPTNNWNALKGLSKKDRQYVLKPSGFSANAYGSRGVAIGHDLPEAIWATQIDTALKHFPSTPYILQEFHKAARSPIQYYDFFSDTIKSMRGRVLLRPYYYVVGSTPRLAGIQAVICPADKKLIHGMSDAVLVPCAVKEATTDF